MTDPALSLVKQAHLETSGDVIANPTAAELWLADRIIALSQCTSSGFAYAKPPRQVDLDLDDKEPI